MEVKSGTHALFIFKLKLFQDKELTEFSIVSFRFVVQESKLNQPVRFIVRFFVSLNQPLYYMDNQQHKEGRDCVLFFVKLRHVISDPSLAG